MVKTQVTWDEVSSAVIELSRKINLSDWKPEVIVGISRGGTIPAVMLSHFMDIPMIPMNLSISNALANDSLPHLAEEAATGKRILIVDEINDNGRTIRRIKQDWEKNKLTTMWDTNWDGIWGVNVKFATLYDNLGSDEFVDYFVHEIDKTTSPTWLEFPWEKFW